MSVKVKICGLVSLKDAEAAVDLGADALGFVFDPASPRYIGDKPDSLAIPSQLGPYALCCAVYGRYQKVAPPHYGLIQFIESDFPRLLRPFLKVIRIGPQSDLESVLRQIGDSGSILLDAFSPGEMGGSGKKIDLELASHIAQATSAKIVLAGGFDPQNVADAIQKIKPYAVDVSSGVEKSPGVKDMSKIRDFIQAAKNS